MRDKYTTFKERYEHASYRGNDPYDVEVIIILLLLYDLDLGCTGPSLEYVRKYKSKYVQRE